MMHLYFIAWSTFDIPKDGCQDKIYLVTMAPRCKLFSGYVSLWTMRLWWWCFTSGSREQLVLMMSEVCRGEIYTVVAENELLSNQRPWFWCRVFKVTTEVKNKVIGNANFANVIRSSISSMLSDTCNSFCVRVCLPSSSQLVLDCPLSWLVFLEEMEN